ncbi:hypothetical protein HAQ01_04865 [Acidithiobacillus thiooxidans]|uniref:hypothetical protein n=1 Tax=Acidithiobacillus thiooxidans TaxID=930 RepID=UPI001C06B144|nr:hypothetical protein [Acidithiobacillus thiooxidans]MBU2792741.1 hypothetical protein [Acidithiobacillus thiooxidans]
MLHRKPLSTLLLALGAMAAVQSASAAPDTTCVPGSVILNQVGKNIPVEVPAKENGCSVISVKLSGAAGGSSGRFGSGGAGGLLQFNLPAAKFSGLWMATVGQAGANAIGRNGGNGGGYTSVSFSGYTNSYTKGHTLGMAGGGGGGAAGQSGGFGGEPKSDLGEGTGCTGDHRCLTEGKGGTPFAGGQAGEIYLGMNNAFGPSYNGSYLRGGAGQGQSDRVAGVGGGGVGGLAHGPVAGGGGGGGGYFGGGGGSDGSSHYAGPYFDGAGGGAANYVINAAQQVHNTPGGGGQSGVQPQNGSIVIRWHN